MDESTVTASYKMLQEVLSHQLHPAVHHLQNRRLSDAAAIWSGGSWNLPNGPFSFRIMATQTPTSGNVWEKTCGYHGQPVDSSDYTVPEKLNLI